jgi:hypothetical protein
VVESRREKEKMYPQRKKMMRQVFGLGLLVALVVLALSACGGGAEAGGQEEEAKARPLPEQPQELRPGEYRSEEFEPSVSFRVGEGWSLGYPEAPDFIEMVWEEKDGVVSINNVQKVVKPIYDPTESSKPKLVEAPEDLVGWYQDHPYLKTSKPEPVTVGGVKGQQLDMVAEVPEDHLSKCGAGCVDLFTGTSADWAAIYEGDKFRSIVLEDVKGETVYIDYGGPAPDFDEIAPEAQKVVDTVEWGDS